MGGFRAFWAYYFVYLHAIHIVNILRVPLGKNPSRLEKLSYIQDTWETFGWHWGLSAAGFIQCVEGTCQRNKETEINILLTCSSASEAFFSGRAGSRGGEPEGIYFQSLSVPVRETEECQITEGRVLVCIRNSLQAFFMLLQLQWNRMFTASM